MRLTAGRLLALALVAASAFDFDEDEADVRASGSTAGFSGGADGAGESVQLLHAFGAAEFATRGTIAYREARQYAHDGKASVSIRNNKLTPSELDALRAAISAGEYYSVSLPSKLRDAKSPPVVASVSACALVASGFREQLHLSMSSVDELVAISYSVPVVPASCPADTAVPADVTLQTTVTLSFPHEGPRPVGKISDAGFLPQAAAAAAARSADGKDGGDAQPQPPQSFVRRYWMYILPVVLMMTLSGGPEPEAGKPGGQGGAAAPAGGGGGSGGGRRR